MKRRVVRLLTSVVIVVVIAAAMTWGVGLAWTAIGGGAMSRHGWIALTLGVAGTVALSWLLMGLAFKSDREGWDDRVDNQLDPGRKD